MLVAGVLAVVLRSHLDLVPELPVPSRAVLSLCQPGPEGAHTGTSSCSSGLQLSHLQTLIDAKKQGEQLVMPGVRYSTMLEQGCY